MMKVKIAGPLTLIFLALTGCGGDSGPAEFKVITSNSLVTNALPGIRKACPGLDKYAPQLSNIRVEQQFRTVLLFEVSGSKKIPEAYKAGGQTCFIEIDTDGKSIFVEKKACKSVCQDQLTTSEGQLKLSVAK